MPAHGERISVLLVEDHQALRQGLELLLRASGISLAGVAATNVEACRLHAARRPAVTVVDVTLGSESGLSAIEHILESDADAAVVVYTGADGRDVIAAAARSGARGFVLKAGGSEELVAAIRAVAGGDVYVDPAVTAFLAASGPSLVLTGREREVLTLLAQGLTGACVAKTMFLSSDTVRTHIRNAMQRLGAHTRVHAVALALALGEISLDPPAATVR